MAPLLLNAVMGESLGTRTMGDDMVLMPLSDLANIACGFHTSNQNIMRSTVRLASERGVTIGGDSQPSYPK